MDLKSVLENKVLMSESLIPKALFSPQMKKLDLRFGRPSFFDLYFYFRRIGEIPGHGKQETRIWDQGNSDYGL